MITIENSIIINRPVEEVFAFVDNPENTPSWDQVTQNSEITSDGPMGVGTTGHNTSRFLGRNMELDWVITEYEANRKRASKSTSGPIDVEIVQTFEAIEGGTKVTFKGQFETGGFFKLAEPVVSRMGNRQTQSNLANLKDLLEA